MLCLYRVKPGKEDEFLGYLRKHKPMLDSVGLASDKPAELFRARAKQGGTVFVELFEWKTAQSSDIAHQTPEVMQVWEPMGALTDGMEFLHIEPVAG
jgi:hypothetical protein